jgi:hypothetical protein
MDTNSAVVFAAVSTSRETVATISPSPSAAARDDADTQTLPQGRKERFQGRKRGFQGREEGYQGRISRKE